MPTFIVKTAATKPNTGGIPVPTTVQAAPTAQPLPIAITDLLTQLADAWQTWQTAPVAAVYPDVTATDAPDPAGEAAIVKAQRRGVGVDNARWESLLTRVGPAKALSIRARAAQESLTLARTMGITSTDAVAITKGLIVATEPGRRR